MPANYLHGVETVTTDKGARAVSVVKSAVVALVGIAPKGPVNEPTLILSTRDAEQFGDTVPGFNIPQALAAILAQGPATVIVMNVFDTASHTAQVNAEAVPVLDGAFKLAAAQVADLVIKDNAGATVFVLGTDYEIDTYGNGRVISAAIAEGSVLQASYKKLDATKVTAADLIGEYDEVTAARTGLRAYEFAFNLFGFNPKILIAPGYSTIPAVKDALITAAEKYRAVTFIDAPEGKTPAQMVADRGPAGTVFNTNSKRAILTYPNLKAYDAATDSNIIVPASAFWAGVMCATDYNEGYWFSPSNHEIKGITGVERPISAHISDANSEANLLNEKGIATIFNSYGSGFRTWGNRSASFPIETHPTNFISVQRVKDILEESVELAMLPFIDRPINGAIVDAIKESVNSFIRTLIGRGALIDGRCVFNRELNPDIELAAGKIVFSLEFMPPTPAERITFTSFLNVEFLKLIK